MRTLVGTDHYIWCPGDQNTIQYVKEILSTYCIPGLAKDTYWLLKNQIVLKETQSLKELQIQDGELLHLGLRCRTGRVIEK